MADVERFDIENVTQIFLDSLKNEDDVLMDEYLNAYEEINRFFHLIGSVFGFVSSDVRSKIDILQDFRKKENGEKFVSIKSMMEYEKEMGLLRESSSYVSGSRTLLRLHRGLVKECDDDAETPLNSVKENDTQPRIRRRKNNISFTSETINDFETEETRTLSTNELQRLVLLEQLKLIRIQIAKEEGWVRALAQKSEKTRIM